MYVTLWTQQSKKYKVTYLIGKSAQREVLQKQSMGLVYYHPVVYYAIIKIRCRAYCRSSWYVLPISPGNSQPPLHSTRGSVLFVISSSGGENTSQSKAHTLDPLLQHWVYSILCAGGGQGGTGFEVVLDQETLWQAEQNATQHPCISAAPCNLRLRTLEGHRVISKSPLKVKDRAEGDAWRNGKE